MCVGRGRGRRGVSVSVLVSVSDSAAARPSYITLIFIAHARFLSRSRHDILLPYNMWYIYVYICIYMIMVI